MNMTKNQKLLVVSASSFVIMVSTIIAARALYTNTKIGTDRRTLLISSGLAITGLYTTMKLLKK